MLPELERGVFIETVVLAIKDFPCACWMCEDMSVATVECAYALKNQSTPLRATNTSDPAGHFLPAPALMHTEPPAEPQHQEFDAEEFDARIDAVLNSVIRRCQAETNRGVGLFEFGTPPSSLGASASQTTPELRPCELLFLTEAPPARPELPADTSNIGPPARPEPLADTSNIGPPVDPTISMPPSFLDRDVVLHDMDSTARPQNTSESTAYPFEASVFSRRFFLETSSCIAGNVCS